MPGLESNSGCRSVPGRLVKKRMPSSLSSQRLTLLPTPNYINNISLGSERPSYTANLGCLVPFYHGSSPNAPTSAIETLMIHIGCWGILKISNHDLKNTS